MLGVGPSLYVRVCFVTHCFAHLSLDPREVRDNSVVHNRVDAESKWMLFVGAIAVELAARICARRTVLSVFAQMLRKFESCRGG